MTIVKSLQYFKGREEEEEEEEVEEEEEEQKNEKEKNKKKIIVIIENKTVWKTKNRIILFIQLYYLAALP